MSSCALQVDVRPIPPIVAGVGNTAPAIVSGVGATAPPIVASARAIASGITGTVGARPAIDASVLARPAITVDVGARPPIVVEVGGCMSSFLDTLELRAARAQRDVVKLAAYTTAINVPGVTPVELPTGLVIYPSFRDTGLIEISVGAAHANMNGATLTLALMMGPAGALVNVANFTTPAINPASSAGNFQLEFMLRVRSRGPQALNYGGWFQWNDASGPQQSPIVGRITTANFGNPANGDNGDVEVRLDASLSTSGPTLNLSGYLIEQHSPRALAQ